MQIGTSGGAKMSTMMDVLDLFGSRFLATQPLEISKQAEPMLTSFGSAVKASVIAEASFLCLKTVAPAAMSLLPALAKGSYATKLVFPQDILPGWIVRFVPCLYAPLTGIFILLMGQIFSVWFVMGAVLCLCCAQLSVALFGSGFEMSTTDKDSTVQLAKIGRAYHYATAFNLGAVGLFATAIYRNPDIRTQMDVEHTVTMVRMVFFIILKFMVPALPI
jgi:hypothetical protein